MEELPIEILDKKDIPKITVTSEDVLEYFPSFMENNKDAGNNFWKKGWRCNVIILYDFFTSGNL